MAEIEKCFIKSEVETEMFTKGNIGEKFNITAKKGNIPKPLKYCFYNSKENSSADLKYRMR